ncbi:hypothetical protein BBK36DRAFT_1166853 [Trichoderma citrinoviride]|uniref:Large ribosomal subunit protein bL33m n=1 Tax=Trichoderma citrinoviride TaxID=58853 RepID=A0A2T4BI81_9HYPO|nr:hypothetical protein BBK36DRAFT_1166853 [Trichoderma citrinoviride]PTB68981.1 hypothetical protein BBK36DRAFT_1166853 [Trichoderma citrinoviride]
MILANGLYRTNSERRESESQPTSYPGRAQQRSPSPHGPLEQLLASGFWQGLRCTSKPLSARLPPNPTKSSDFGATFTRESMLVTKARLINVRLISMAMTGFFYTFKRPRTAPMMGMLKYDPIVRKKVLFLETKKRSK